MTRPEIPIADSAAFTIAQRSDLAREAEQHGLYNTSFEHDACGMGFVASIKGLKSHAIVKDALQVLENMDHRGATGCDPCTGDGAGILVQVPDKFLRRVTKGLGIELPEAGKYAAGMLFMPRDNERRERMKDFVSSVLVREGLNVLGYREVPTDPQHCGDTAREVMPSVQQVFVTSKAPLTVEAFELKLHVARRCVATEMPAQGLAKDPTEYFACSLSSRTLVYKGMLMPEQVSKFYPDLREPDFETAIALVHSRFSTNTMPSWSRAHPYRFICHNGEINTFRGNMNAMAGRQAKFKSEELGADVKKLLPVIAEGGSDSEGFDNALELITRTGRSLPHAVMMMIPEAWQNHEGMSDEKKAFYEYHSSMMEPWDGPASIAFTDGTVVGAVLDRNGLRPSRYTVTKDDVIVVASETGVLDIPAANVAHKGRLEPGRMLLVDTKQGRIVDDRELKSGMASRQPYRKWLTENLVKLSALPEPDELRLPSPLDRSTLIQRQRVFGYTREDVRMLIRPMAQNGEEAIGSMGTDTPLAVLSDRPQLLFNYFKQQFAQVTNPPVDPLREELVMSLKTMIGAEQNLFAETPEHAHLLQLEHPIIKTSELQAIKDLDFRGLRTKTLDTLFDVDKRGKGLEEALSALCADAEKAVDEGFSILVLSDRKHDKKSAAIPSLLATAAVHHHLIRVGKRTGCGLVVETGEAREIMHFCLLLGYGAGAINPYLAFESILSQTEEGLLGKTDNATAIKNYIKAADKGILKVMSKMGISTLHSYRGAQIFEAIGLSSALIKKYFTWTASRIEGIGLEEIATEVALRHHVAWDVPVVLNPDLDPGGIYQWRRRGEYHMYNPQTVASLQHAVRSGDYKLFKRYTAQVNAYSEKLCTIRGLLKIKKGTPIPLEEVEPAKDVVKRFKTGAMSFGSLSKEAHENLAIAMNRIGARSNTGEGGEDPARYKLDENGDSRRSAIKQVASGRFGVTIQYLVNSDEIQIKMAQGAKPGEGGQLPGHKVDEMIARVRFSTPGVGLISPPPHHDIYSIEDLAQLIHDLKNSNKNARISVKLVSETGVGTVAAGVAKAKADLVLISADSGGTGASPLTSIKHAGAPWELGLAETHQTLLLNGLRNRIKVETDGQIKTGRDVLVAALLGAEEFGFGTSALVASGCILMRVCHLNTCPVGVATQDPELRKRFQGQPEHVINFMMFMAEELRELMAELGFRTVAEMVGRVDLLEADKAVDHWKAKGLDLSRLLHKPNVPAGAPLYCTEVQDHGIAKALDNQLIEKCAPALDKKEKVKLALPINNVNRTVTTMLSAELARRFDTDSLPQDLIELTFTGSAGQSFGAFMARGISTRIIGEVNDYLGKGLSGGRIVLVPPPEATFAPEDNIIAGNVALYGATTGQVFIRGRAGERFCVRNSGATAVVEGVGDHGCEYMTKGLVVVLGRTGRNFAAGMSGGVAYVLDEDGTFNKRCNPSMVDLDHLEPADDTALKRIITRHLEETGSGVAKRLLDSWGEASSKFIKVFPREYKRVLAEQRYDSEIGALATGM
jgi:glutamate synthase domain-containing protein 2/glutamate synthase domain-containing protein 1/glutamate synthase domain-containing protein 3